jgi:integrase
MTQENATVPRTMPVVGTPVGPPVPQKNPIPMLDELETLRRLSEKYPFLFHQSDPRDLKTIAEVIRLYVNDAKGELDTRTHEYRARHLASFALAFGMRQVPQCTPFELKQWIHEHYQNSAWTRLGVNSSVQRAMNWAVTMRIIRENPFRGLKLNEQKKHGRDMKPEELQALLRASDPYFRRFMMALALTGARPGELASLQWAHVDWERNIAVLKKHKTSKKTGKPRVLVFPPAFMKLLSWIKDNGHERAAVELRNILEAAPNREARIRDVVNKLQSLGYSYRAIYRARQAIGATYRRVGGWREHGYTVYRLPENAKPAPVPHGQYVFLCSKCHPWNRTALGTKFRRLRAHLGLPAKRSPAPGRSPGEGCDALGENVF